MIKHIDPRSLKWICQPQLYIISADKIVLETEPETELNPSGGKAPAAELFLAPQGSFCFTARCDFEYRRMFDQCGLIVYKGEARAAVLAAEYRNQEFMRMQTTVFHDGCGDRSVRDIGSAIRYLYYRIWYRNGMFSFQYSFNGKVYTDLRKFRISNTEEEIRIGLFACSPGKSYFDCTFSKMTLEEN